MKKSAFISDVIFAFGAAFLPALCLLRYKRFPLWAALALSAIAGAFAAFAVFAFLRKKREKLCLEKRDEEMKEKLLLHLTLQGETKNLDYFSRFFEGHGEDGSPAPSPKAVRLGKRRGASFVKTEDGDFYPLFSLCPLDADRVAPLLCGEKDAAKYLLCGELSPEAEKLCARFDVRVMKGADVYRMLKKGDALPKTYLGGDLPQRKKKRVTVWFAKANSRRFLLGGALILLTSLLTPFPFYYLVSGSILILSAVFVRIFGYR